MKGMISKDRLKQFMKIEMGHVVKDACSGNLYMVARVDTEMHQLICISKYDFGNRYIDDCFTKEDLIVYLASEENFEYFGEFEDYKHKVSKKTLIL